MIVPDTNLRQARTRRVAHRGRFLLWTAIAVLLCAGGWTLWVYGQIRYYANRDNARPADAIAVFGAAEYDGRPSPVLRARLDHALNLYQRGLAPLVITLGGGYEADAQHSEGDVGADYLMAHGVPENAIIAETESDDTEQSAERLTVIAHENGLQRIIAVSDGTHLFRIHAICEHDGLQVFTSPRPPGRGIPLGIRAKRLTHEILSYTAWRLGLH
ncbi:MAG TPA: YdcF family protein [Acidobacteriaceae bacterium]|nr:YdcF family protein [Acidobacteriaceae bacterium]